MTIQKSKLVKKDPVAVGTMAFYFQKPASFEYRAGQTIDLTITETGGAGITYTFSLASAPYEEQLFIATRMRDTAFKRVLGKMEPGAEVGIDGPFGSFVLHNNASKPAIFLAGGIGITPFFSIAKQATHAGLPHQMSLLYSNRRPEDAPFLKELKELEEKNQNFNAMAINTERTGHITGEMIVKIPDYQNAIFYLAGPPRMVAGMFKILKNLAIDTDYIKTDEFAGY